MVISLKGNKGETRLTIQIHEEIGRLIQYGLQKGLITKWDKEYTINQLLDVLQLDSYEKSEVPYEELDSPVDILNNMLDWAYEYGVLKENTVTYRDLLDTKIMSCLMPRPSEVKKNFEEILDQEGPEKATSYFYQLSKAVHYIRTDRIAKNESWKSKTEYGDLEITINLSKPEKDPKAIAAAKNLASTDYPKCLLCKENVGYKGRVNHPARQNLRVIPVELDGEQWFMQFSPYVYYNEHAIVFSHEHRPMKISRNTFARLLDFVQKYPHYFIGSNADLPIVGGSILNHDHYQGGYHEFPMAKAEMEETFTFSNFDQVKAGIVKWPMSVIRLQSENRVQLIELANQILHLWREYSDEQVEILAHSNEERHNTITPIARKKGNQFELDLVLRNNRTDERHPLGIFHPHNEVHHIKKENIGLIEVMGLAVLPGRLKEEMKALGEYLVKDEMKKIKEDERTAKHYDWAMKMKNQYGEFPNETIHDVLRKEVGQVFSIVLEHAGVFKRNKQGKSAFLRFIEYIQENVR